MTYIFSDERKCLLKAGHVLKESKQHYDGEDALAKYAMVLAYNRLEPTQAIRKESFLKRCRLEYVEARYKDGEPVDVYKHRAITDEETSKVLTDSDEIVRGILEADKLLNSNQERVVEISPDIDENTDVRAVFLAGFHVNSASVDDETADWVLLSFMGSREITGDGLHLKATGEFGTGKSYTVNSALFALPEKVFYKGAFTDKALLYEKNMPAGMIIKLDEAQNKSISFESIIKEATSNFQTGVQYHTIRDKEEGTIILPLSPRMTFILLSADAYGDEQTISRFVPLGFTKTENKTKLMTDFRLQKRIDAVPKLHTNETVLESRKILTHFADRKFKVSIPWAKEHIQYNTKDQRVQEWFECAVMYTAVLNYKKRNPTVEDGVICIEATKEDFESAARFSIFHNIQSAEHRFTPSEIETIHLLRKNGYQGRDIPKFELAKLSGKSDARITQIMRGRDPQKVDGGLMAKLGITEINMSQSNISDPNLSFEDIQKRQFATINQKAYRIPEVLPDVAPSGQILWLVRWKD